jgi:hypothetical protein
MSSPTSATSPPPEEPSLPAAPSPAPDRLSARGRQARVVISLAVGALLVIGTFWGSDDNFPFGPFRMYAFTNKPDGVVLSTRVEAIDVTGRRFKLSDQGSGLRRAELEGQLPRFQESPELLAELAGAYEQRHPDAPPVARVEIYRRSYHLEDGRPTGEHVDRLLTSWDLRDLEVAADAEPSDGSVAARQGNDDPDGRGDRAAPSEADDVASDAGDVRPTDADGADR